MAAPLFPRRTRPALRIRQRGVVLVIVLISLVLLLIGVTAMLRTVDTTSLVVGNLAFRRDLTNRAETAIAQAKAEFVSGGLSTAAARQVTPTTVPNTLNYSASTLPSNSDGIPLVLVRDSLYSGNFVPTTIASDASLTVRWVIDRQCLTDGAYSSSTCENVVVNPPPGGSGGSAGHQVNGQSFPVYRISVRVSGPRSTDAYFQAIYVN
jgi:Tfp pilus assembly protein PilX